MTGREYRQDDLRDTGYCPRCGQPLAAITTGARGYCETHGWQYADWHGSPGPTYLRPTDERGATNRRTAPIRSRRTGNHDRKNQPAPCVSTSETHPQ